MKLTKRVYKHEEFSDDELRTATRFLDNFVLAAWHRAAGQRLGKTETLGMLYGQGTTTQNSALNYTIQTQAYQSTAGTDLGQGVAYFGRPYTLGEW